MNKKSIITLVVMSFLAIVAAALVQAGNLTLKKNVATGQNEQGTATHDTLKATVNVIEKQSPDGFRPMVVIKFPDIPGSRNECWCYETGGLTFVSYEKIFGDKLILKHKYDGGTVITDVIPYRDKVVFTAHVVDQTKKPPVLNMCWQLREAENFKAVDRDHYCELVDREFIFMKDSGRVFLNKTVRRPKIGTKMTDKVNNPYPWTQIYKPDWKNVHDTSDCEGWSNCSTDRYSQTIIGAVSRDGKWLMAIASDSTATEMCNAWHDCMHVWVPWKDGVWRNVIYAGKNDPDLLLERYDNDLKNSFK